MKNRKSKKNHLKNFSAFDPSLLREPPSAMLNFPMIQKNSYNPKGIFDYYGMKQIKSTEIVTEYQTKINSYTYILNKRRATINGIKIFLSLRNTPVNITIFGSDNGVTWDIIEENEFKSESNYIFVNSNKSFQFFRICSTQKILLRDFEIYGKVDRL